ncbi:adenosylmethionine decarboxylase [Actimicrobium sp. CCI2.3]|uniref:adenosylmethionine decarboxylase n=1 Tax=Actimicrobium sp. CCI2.3 TaxID=3048616 RepID=UPI002AB5BA1D|nr:adenosylmethionine decarboxylase [Actimicrobium sp. CCI2.3]MDY7574909.1 adenosylmethionine decarboxylase [Actimicrobium sp. CCI2.3]MEB0023360.1 adenosylmethionine decarboxylase [Actimicrobium sp. CCI2.3]
MGSSYQPAGAHLLADFYGVDASRLADCTAIELLLYDAALAANARIVHSHFHAFGEGKGVTGVLLLAESHISIHTWPEFGFAAADIFMCGSATPEGALEVIRQALEPVSVKLQIVARGQATDPIMAEQGSLRAKAQFDDT